MRPIFPVEFQLDGACQKPYVLHNLYRPTHQNVILIKMLVVSNGLGCAILLGHVSKNNKSSVTLHGITTSFNCIIVGLLNTGVYVTLTMLLGYPVPRPCMDM